MISDKDVRIAELLTIVEKQGEIIEKCEKEFSEQKQFWLEVKVDLNTLDDNMGRTQFMEVHNPIKRIDETLDYIKKMKEVK